MSLRSWPTRSAGARSEINPRPLMMLALGPVEAGQLPL
jgi:hypothetical protein